MIRRLLLICLAIAAGVTSARAQYAAFKSADGILLISQRPGQYFSLDLPGRKIIPVGQNEATHPSFIICDRPGDQPKDGRFIQVMPVPLAEFRGRPSESDESLLRKQANYEINYWHPRDSELRMTQLQNGRAALLWKMVVAKKLPTGSTQLFLSFREGNYIVVLSSNVPGGHTLDATENYLRRVAHSFRSAARPMATPIPSR